jgi:hypothetical protein
MRVAEIDTHVSFGGKVGMACHFLALMQHTLCTYSLPLPRA